MHEQTRAGKYFEIVVYIRFLKLLSMLYEIKALRVIIITTQHLMKPLIGLVLVIATIFYIASNILMMLFGGLIYPSQPSLSQDSSIPPYYSLLNFNDLASSWVTLFALVIVNNWFVIVQMYVDVTGVQEVRWLFIVFFYFGVIIGVNIIIAFAIDMFAAVERMDTDYETNTEKLVKKSLQKRNAFLRSNIEVSQELKEAKLQQNRIKKISDEEGSIYRKRGNPT